MGSKGAQPFVSNEDLLAIIARLERENQILREQLELLKKGLFGRKSERIDPDQLRLWDDLTEEESEPEVVPVPRHTRRKKGKTNGRVPFPDHLPREIIECDVAEEDRVCSCCQAALVPIGEDTCERGHFVPAQILVRRYVKKKYGCPNGHEVKTAAAPESLIERAKYEPSVYAHVVASKYQDHLPLHRMSGIFKRHGIHLPKQTMWDMLVRVYELFAKRILEQMHLEILEEDILQGDETPVGVRLEDQRGSQKGYVWTWLTLSKKILLIFTLTKERDGPTRFLGDWVGTGLVDGASNYNEALDRKGVIRAGCWAHARRKIKDAWGGGAKEAVRLLVPVQRLFRLERAIAKRVEARELDEDERLALVARVRSRRSAKLIEKIDNVRRELLTERGVLPKSLLGKAVTYLTRQAGPLSRFLEDPRLPIHNNASERSLRHVAVGRNNWMIFASERGGKVACALYSLMLSCRALDIDPEAYLTDCLERVATTPVSQIASLTPWAWAEAHPEARIDGPPQS